MRRELERRLSFEALQNKQLDQFTDAVLICDHRGMDAAQQVIDSCEVMIVSIDSDIKGRAYGVA